MRPETENDEQEEEEKEPTDEPLTMYTIPGTSLIYWA
jgi:hypothetical protein